MKILNKEKMRGQNLIKYALTERNVLSMMNCEFIVKLEFAFQNENKLFLLLEYCPSGNLSELLDEMMKFPEEIAKIYVAEILIAIEALHLNDIIYRDLKPDNIVLDAQGHCKLTDFGLSKEGVKDPRQADSFCGSIAYLAPEILEKTGHGKSVDWYLLGVLIVEMLTGVPPFFKPDKEEMFFQIINENYNPPDYLSKNAEDIILKVNPTF